MPNHALVLSMASFRTASLSLTCTLTLLMCNPPSNPATRHFGPPNFPWPVTDARERPEIFAQHPGDDIRWRHVQLEPCNQSQTCHQNKMKVKSKHSDVSKTATTFKFSFACEVCPSSGQTDSFAPKQLFRISACPKVQTSPQGSPTFACGAMLDISFFCYLRNATKMF